ncbi:hypothetical protein BFP72_07665 [Reichenbachiella sp. 5M10]|uniref:hypothetical protein n=1 Tax=Reichenbachiella sp. 5M10 TaxID=1889772 RepID=UPI000C15801F|nr:hypothetical protein [Reichenbachiella sp. 5M10]PIB37457.1 hypothetical protein BFP72_07665 [Reichenbachiella sp. 5M10]
MKFTRDALVQVLEKKQYRFFDNQKPYNLNIIGIRSNNPIANSFDDWLYLIYRDEHLEWKIFEFAITTDPGNYWLQNPSNVNGTAILVPGQYRQSHAIGLHQGRYEALKQQRPVTVWRDNDRDTSLDMNGPTDTGIFGINIHRSNANGESTVVEKWSAGCQVFKKVNDFNFFMDTCREAARRFGNSFTYTLLEESEF